MKLTLAQFSDAPGLRIVALSPDGSFVADVSSALKEKTGEEVTSMRRFLDIGAPAFEVAAAAFADAKFHRPAAGVALKAPIYDPEKVLCVGMNYADHCTEQNLPIPTEPVIFSKFATAIAASGDPLIKPPETSELDFEVELAIIIGKTGRRIKPEDAMSHVAGYAVSHDVSARDWQLKKNGGQWLLGKCPDGFAPLGPLVTLDEVGDPHKLHMRTILNGTVVQDGSTETMVFKTEAIIAWISKLVTLKPGDVILTGTPPGVGCFRKPQLWLKAGDVVTCEIEKLGAVTNTVVDEVL